MGAFMEIILNKVINALNDITVCGEKNLNLLLASIQTLGELRDAIQRESEKIEADDQQKP